MYIQQHVHTVTIRTSSKHACTDTIYKEIIALGSKGIHYITEEKSDQTLPGYLMALDLDV